MTDKPKAGEPKKNSAEPQQEDATRSESAEEALPHTPIEDETDETPVAPSVGSSLKSPTAPPASESTKESPKESPKKSPEPRPEVSTHKQKQRRPWLALVILVLVAVGIGSYFVFLLYQQVNQQSQTLAAMQTGVSQSQDRFSTSMDELAQQAKKSSLDLQRQLQQTQIELKDLQLRLSAQSKRLQAMSDTSRDDWLLAEAQYLLKLANQRVRIERNADGAEALLEEADAILRDLENPDLFPLRRAIAQDLAALRLMRKIDVEGIYLSLQALTDVIDDIPLRPTEKGFSALPAVPIDEDIEKTFLQTLAASWRGFLASLNQYIKHDRVDDETKTLLSADETMYLQQNLNLILQRAQLALLRENQDIYTSSLLQADRWSDTHFFSSMPLLEFRNELQALSKKSIAQDLPDISQSLNLLHDYIETLHDLDGITLSSDTQGSKP